jgi:hypothetical protein
LKSISSLHPSPGIWHCCRAHPCLRGRDLTSEAQPARHLDGCDTASQFVMRSFDLKVL